MFDPKPHLIQLPQKRKHPATGQWETTLTDYLPVAARVAWFRTDYPHGSIDAVALTIDFDKGLAIFQATVEDGEGGKAVAYAHETRAGYADFLEKSHTRAVGRALALLGYGSTTAGEELTEGEHVADAPVATTTGNVTTIRDSRATDTDRPVPEHGTSVPSPTTIPAEGDGRISRDQARELKKVAQTAYGYAAGERRLREDLGLEADQSLTLMRLEAHTSPERYAALIHAYEGDLKAEVEADVPDHAPPALQTSAPVTVTTVEPPGNSHDGEPVTTSLTGVTPPNGQPEREAAERQRWSRLSRRSMATGLSASVWESLRLGAYVDAERVIGALEQATAGRA